MIDQLATEHIGILGVSGPAAIGMVWKYIKNLQSTIDENQRFIAAQAEKDKEHTLKIEKLEEQIGYLRAGAEKKEGEGAQALRDLEQRIEKRFDEHKESSKADHEKLEKKIDQLIFTLQPNAQSRQPQQPHQPNPPGGGVPGW